jgi:hypothetical protein
MTDLTQMIRWNANFVRGLAQSVLDRAKVIRSSLTPYTSGFEGATMAKTSGKTMTKKVTVKKAAKKSAKKPAAKAAARSSAGSKTKRTHA